MDNKYLKEKVEKFDETTSLSGIQKYIQEMVEIRGFVDETPQDIMILLTEEIGELAKEVRKASHIKVDSKNERINNFKGELSDVLTYVICMANRMDIDLVDALKQKELKNCEREWK